jgi:perosamine synthetase
LIEDAAQAVGSDYWGKADYTCVSLQAIKTLTSGDGGFLICKDKEDYIKAKKLRWFGYDRELKQKIGDCDLDLAGYKYHMNDITAAIGRGNLAVIDKIIAKRKNIMAFYNKYANIRCHIWLCIQYGKEGDQHHYRNDKYSLFKKFKNKCPIMDVMENSWRLLPLYPQLSLKQAKKYAES